MTACVVDASVLIEMLRGTSLGQKASEALRASATTLAAPAHLDAEVLAALLQVTRRFPQDRAGLGERVALLARAPIRRFPLPPLLTDALALHGNITPYDALYVVLARHLHVPLFTCDLRLARSLSPAGDRVWAGGKWQGVETDGNA